MSHRTEHPTDEVITQFLRTRSADPDLGLLGDIMRTAGATPQDRSWLGLRPILLPRKTLLIVAFALLLATMGAIAVGSGLVPPDGRPEGIFADVSGWIAYGDHRGIWAVDPTRPGDPDSQVQLSSKDGTPIAWSPDGSKLLVLRNLSDLMDSVEMVLFVLNADGTETRLAQAGDRSAADFTPDGSQVVYGDGDNIYVIDAEGGTPELLLAGDPPLWTFSPDGTQIAYIDWGHGDSGHSVRVMNSDGTGMRVVVEDSMNMGAGHIRDFGLDWSPDGQHLVFANTRGVYVVGIDGSGLIEVSSLRFEGADPHWSPDGSLISHNFGSLAIVRWDGTQAQRFDYARSGPWNPR
jgi:hypothetical protein